MSFALFQDPFTKADKAITRLIQLLDNETVSDPELDNCEKIIREALSAYQKYLARVDFDKIQRYHSENIRLTNFLKVIEKVRLCIRQRNLNDIIALTIQDLDARDLKRFNLEAAKKKSPAYRAMIEALSAE